MTSYFFTLWTEKYEDQKHHQYEDCRPNLDIVCKRHHIEVLKKALKKAKIPW